MRIRRGLSSRHLACGCLAGIYETYRDEIVTIIDARGDRCASAEHIPGYVVPVAATAASGWSGHESSRK